MRDLGERPRRAVERDLAALDAGKPCLQRAGQASDGGITRHDLDQRSRGFELAGGLSDLIHGQKQQAVLLEELAGAKRLDGGEIPRIALQFPFQRGSRRAREFRRRSLDDGKDSVVPIERLFKLLIALPPVQVRGDQLVDVGIDGKVMRRVDARGSRQHEPHEHGERGKPGARPNHRDDETCQHIMTF